MSWPRLTGEISARYRETGEIPEISYPNGTRIRLMLTDEEWLELWARHDQYPAGRDR